MPVTIYLPSPGDLVGPGMRVQFVSDFIGPLASNATWSIRVSTDPEFGTVAYSESIPATSDFGSLVTALNSSASTLVAGDEAVVDGTTVHVQVLLNDGSGVVDDGVITATWKPTTNAWVQTAEIVAEGGAGLTTEQSQQLADDHASINPPLLASDGTAITGAVGDLIVSPALKLLGIDTSTHVLVGQGTLDVPTFAGVQTGWGLVLDVLDFPSGTSYMPGYVRSFHPRAGQFLLLWPAKNTAEAMVLEELRLHLEHFTWKWDLANVIAVAYYITPGWTVQARFVSAFFP